MKDYFKNNPDLDYYPRKLQMINSSPKRYAIQDRPRFSPVVLIAAVAMILLAGMCLVALIVESLN